ncbi:MAG: hypothetical protein ACRENF_04910, partial [Thermodesulfobacteriota bacterium]
LVRYGVRNITKRIDKTQSKGKFSGIDLIESYNPNVVILGKLTHSERRKNPILKNLTIQIKRFALRKSIKVHEIEPAAARKFLIKDRRPTKMNAAALITAAYPELSAYLPQKGRILWTHKDMYWMNMFDALTLALVYLRKRKRRKDISTYLSFNSKTL